MTYCNALNGVIYCLPFEYASIFSLVAYIVLVREYSLSYSKAGDPQTALMKKDLLHLSQTKASGGKGHQTAIRV